MSTSRGSCIHWFRKGLRLHDNPALIAALKPLENGEILELKPVFVLDPSYDGVHVRVGPNRLRFLLQSLEDLDASLKKLGTRLYVVKGDAVECFTTLFKNWNVKKITWEIDTEPHARTRDAKVRTLARSKNIRVDALNGHTLYDPEEIIAKNKGTAPLTYNKFLAVAASIGPPPKPVGAPSKLKTEAIGSSNCAETTKYDLPTLEDLGVKRPDLLGPCIFHGGETEARRRHDEKLNYQNAAWVRSFSKPTTSPNSLEPSTTQLSPYLALGCLSPRDMYWRLDDIYKGAIHTQPPVSLHGQLLWREFYYTVGSHTPNYASMEGNPVSKQIPWGSDETRLRAWAEAKTGYPWIDAIMTQLRTEGWIHHLARHPVACFLTRGDLWQSWERGREVFEELLIDADWSLNCGNWMWVSASAFFPHYNRVYSPVAGGRKTDKNGDYVRKYLPVLKKFPSEYIYEPWRAPLAVQKAAGCVIGVDYPKRIVNHDVIHKENLGKMKQVYDGGQCILPTKMDDIVAEKKGNNIRAAKERVLSPVGSEKAAYPKSMRWRRNKRFPQSEGVWDEQT